MDKRQAEVRGISRKGHCLRPFRVLCVDDDPGTLESRKVVLEAEGHSVLTAKSGADALQTIERGAKVDVVVLDYIMPGMNGDELANALRQRCPGLPMIAVSAVAPLPERFRTLVDAHVQKGQDAQVLLSQIDEVLAEVGPPADEGPQAPPRTVLCVDDEDLQLKSRKALFESAGYVALQAQSAKAAIELFRSRHVDVVVMDYWLSGKNGTTVAEEMKQIYPSVPIIMLSGLSSLPGEGTLVDSWLRKADIAPDVLLREVERLIDLRRNRRTSTTE